MNIKYNFIIIKTREHYGWTSSIVEYLLYFLDYYFNLKQFSKHTVNDLQYHIL